MSELTIVAVINAKAGREAFVRGELLKLVGPTRGEAGCVRYDLHEDNAEPGRFLFYETWASRELWQGHMGSGHIAAWKEAGADAVESAAVYEMTRVEV